VTAWPADICDLVAPERVVLEIPSIASAHLEQIALRLPTRQSIHARGFQLAFDYSVSDPLV
jgi:EAL and modified HD-GYP domain-containing signal transduction protein